MGRARPFSLCRPPPAMIRLLAAAALVLAALPASAQGTATSPAAVQAADVDPSLIGDWALMKVEALGEMGRYGAEVRDMECAFTADGTAEVRLTVEQDDDVTDRTRSFQFSTDDGEIESEGMPGVAYQVFGGDLLVLRSDDGLVVHLRRVSG